MLEEFSFPWTQPTALTSVQQLGAGSSSMEMVDAFSEDLFGMSEEDAEISLLGEEHFCGDVALSTGDIARLTSSSDDWFQPGLFLESEPLGALSGIGESCYSPSSSQ